MRINYEQLVDKNCSSREINHVWDIVYDIENWLHQNEVWTYWHTLDKNPFPICFKITRTLTCDTCPQQNVTRHSVFKWRQMSDTYIFLNIIKVLSIMLPLSLMFPGKDNIGSLPFIQTWKYKIIIKLLKYSISVNE